MARNLGVAGIQMRVVQGEDNTTRMLKKLKGAVALFPWVDVIFFSELCISGMDLNLAMSLPNPTLDRFIEWAQKEKKWLIPGSFYEKEDSKIYNTSVVISPSGEMTTEVL